MIESLRIEHLAVVEEAELELGPGLNVLTGETGAGKSIVLGALGLLVGRRASSDTVRSGAEEAAVEALLRTELLPDVEAELRARGLAAEDHELVVRRSVRAGGRSRARVGGQLVPASTLAELLAGRVEISSQHASQALLRLETHGLWLDTAGGLLEERRAVERGVAALRALDAERERLRAEAEERLRRRDFLAFQVQEIDAARLDAEEERALEAEHGRLAHADRIREDGAAALAALAGDPAAPDADGAQDRLAAARRSLAGLAELDPGLAELAERLTALDAELRDAALDLERRLDGVDADPARLARLEERLAELERLRRRYGPDVPAILATRDALAAELEGLEGADRRAGELEAERGERLSELRAAAEHLSQGRRGAARELAERVEAGLAELAMPSARFEVALEPAAPAGELPCGATGAEVPEFRFSANPGEPPRALRKVASGGELSRVFLALRGALRGAGRGMVLVFDEVDAGIGGGVAERVGRLLARLARDHQVLCITHLPQIAAFADRHLRVAKHTRRGRSQTRVAAVAGDERVEELARMAGGERVTDATRRHARDLLRACTPS